MADLGLSQEDLVRPEVEGTFRDDAPCTRTVLLRFYGKVSWDRDNGHVVGVYARTVWAERNKGGQLCLTQMTRMSDVRDLAGFQENSSLQSQLGMSHSTTRQGVPAMCSESWVSTSPLGTSNTYQRLSVTGLG